MTHRFCQCSKHIHCSESTVGLILETEKNYNGSKNDTLLTGGREWKNVWPSLCAKLFIYIKKALKKHQIKFFES